MPAFSVTLVTPSAFIGHPFVRDRCCHMRLPLKCEYNRDPLLKPLAPKPEDPLVRLWVICRLSPDLSGCPHYPQKADIRVARRHVGFGPLGDSCTAAITSVFNHLTPGRTMCNFVPAPGELSRSSRPPKRFVTMLWRICRPRPVLPRWWRVVKNGSKA